MANNGGESSRIIEEFNKKHNLSITLVDDPDQRIARRYGIFCWPTTISINASGIVDEVSFGTNEATQFRQVKSAAL